MKTKMCLFFPLFFLSGLAVIVAAQHVNGRFQYYLDGNKYLSCNEGVRTSYVCGVMDGISYANGLISIKPSFKNMLSEISEYTHDIPAGQLNAIVDKYMKDNPHKWNMGMHSLVFDALGESYLKSKKGK